MSNAAKPYTPEEFAARQGAVRIDPEDWQRVRSTVEALATAEARVKELAGLRPEFPPMPPDGNGLPRYGLRWNGPGQPLAVPMSDGYWAPWHLTEAALDIATHNALLLNTGAENARLRADLATATSLAKTLTEERDAARKAAEEECELKQQAGDENVLLEERAAELEAELAAAKESIRILTSDKLSAIQAQFTAEAELAAERELNAATQDSASAETVAHLETMRQRDALRAALLAVTEGPNDARAIVRAALGVKP